MAQRPIIETITVNNTTYDIADAQARQMVIDIPSIQSDITALQTTTQNLNSDKVAKAGDTMSGDLQMNNGIGVKLNRSGGTYARVDAADNQALLRAYASSSSYRGVRVYSPSGQSTDDQGLEYFTNSDSYKVDSTKYATFSGTSLTAQSRTEHTNGTAISSLAIRWPNWHRGMIFGVNFTSASSFSGITHTNESGTSFTPRYVGSKTTLASQRYNLVCWYDGNYAWCVVSATAI